LRRLHNLAVDLGWLAWPILAKRAWPKIRSQQKRAITAAEHGAVIACEGNAERSAYYELLYETGASQTDAAHLSAEDVDWNNGVLVYRRKKLGAVSEPARLTIGSKLRALLDSLPRFGALFPNIKRSTTAHRSAEFRRRCRVAGIHGVSLHYYRHAWAQRAKVCGYPRLTTRGSPVRSKRHRPTRNASNLAGGVITNHFQIGGPAYARTAV
jgi:integrase